MKPPQPRQPAPKRPARRKRRGLPPQSLLVLHLDADRLRADGLHLGDVAHFTGALSTIALSAPAVIKDTTSTGHLHETLAQLATARMKFDVVVVIAHSNAHGIRIASDCFSSWEAFAGYLKPFRPRRLLLVACKAGRWDPGEALFTRLPKLRRIFACPVNASKDFGALMLLAVPYVVALRRPPDPHVTWSQILSVAATGRQLREWRRTADAGNPKSAVFDLIADLADPIARQVPSALVSATKAIFG